MAFAGVSFGMAGFFPLDVVDWADKQLHPLRAFSLRTIEMAGVTGVLLRMFRALLLGTSSVLVLAVGLTLVLILLCGALTWHLANFPLRHWPARTLGFAAVEIAAELGMSTLLIVAGMERYGSRVATWADWWPLAANAVFGRFFLFVIFALALAGSVTFVRRVLQERPGSR